MKEQNNISSDNITIFRVVAMTMVVLYHCIYYYASPSWPFPEGPYCVGWKILGTILGGIHMPVFVFISGYLYWKNKIDGRYKNIYKFYKGKVLRIGIPYLFIGLVLLCLYPQFYSVRMFFYAFCHLWFLMMLFVIFLICPLLWFMLEKIKNTHALIFIWVCLFFLNPLFYKITIFQLCKVFYFLPYFTFGYIIQRCNICRTFRGGY